MHTSDLNSDCECNELASTQDISSAKVQRKKFLKKSGKSLWMKNKTNKANTLSIEVSTKSSEGFSSMGVIARQSSSVSEFNSLPAKLAVLRSK